MSNTSPEDAVAEGYGASEPPESLEAVVERIALKAATLAMMSPIDRRWLEKTLNEEFAPWLAAREREWSKSADRWHTEWVKAERERDALREALRDAASWLAPHCPAIIEDRARRALEEE